MMNKRSKLIAVAAAAAIALGALAGCSGDPAAATAKSPSPGGTTAPASPCSAYWQGVADDFEKAHPNVTVKVEAYQNEELQRTLIPNALRSGSGVDLFQQWGAGELAAQVEAGYVMDISDQVTDEVDAIGGAVAPWQYQGKTYGLPFNFGIEGFWYNKDLFAQAGIDAPPTTLDELYARHRQAEGARTSCRSRSAPATSGRPRTTGTTSL